MRNLIIAESADTISKSIEDLLVEEWEMHIYSNSYEAADMLKYLQPAATIIDSSLLQKQDLYFLKKFSVLIGLSSPTSEHIVDIVNAIGNPPRFVSRHLLSLGFNLNLDGSRYLIAAIHLYAEQPGQRLHKELYPAVRDLCKASSVDSVEHSTRSAIKSAWKKRDVSVWRQYFPQNCDGCPTNKEFIATLAQKL